MAYDSVFVFTAASKDSTVWRPNNFISLSPTSPSLLNDIKCKRLKKNIENNLKIIMVESGNGIPKITDCMQGIGSINAVDPEIAITQAKNIHGKLEETEGY